MIVLLANRGGIALGLGPVDAIVNDPDEVFLQMLPKPLTKSKKG